jgi:hypothetical protein
MRHAFCLLALALAAARGAPAQDRMRDTLIAPPRYSAELEPLRDTWRHRSNLVSLGFGPATGGALGARYLRRAWHTPLAFGVGLGDHGIAPQLEVSLPGTGWIFPDGVTETYLGVDWLVGWRGDLAHTGALVFDVGERTYFDESHVYMEFGIGFYGPLWGSAGIGMLGLAYPRIQVGFTF